MIDLGNPQERARFFELPERSTVMPLSIMAAVLFIAFLSVVLDPNGRAAQLLLDRRSPHFPYPFTIQNFEHLFFFIGLGELFIRSRVAKRELRFLKRGFLPEDDQTVLQMHDLSPIRKRVSREFSQEHGFLPFVIDLSILQFQSGRSVDQAVAVMNSSLELIEHRVDLRYGLVRYIAWLVPTLGFIGTVIGLGSSLAGVPKDGNVSMYEIAHTLSVGFDCTMVALAESAVMVFLLHLAQEKEETSVNLVGTYPLRTLINRLYVGEPRAARPVGTGAQV